MGAERTGLWGHLLRGHLLRGRPGSDTQPCPAGRERRRARGACRGVGASRDSRGQCCFVRAHGFPSRPRSSGPGWGQKPSVGPWPGARGRGLPTPTGASACAFPPPGVGHATRARRDARGRPLSEALVVLPKGQVWVGGRVSAGDPGQVHVLWVWCGH